jgi:hypothetical protein
VIEDHTYRLLIFSISPIVRISPWEVHINDPDFFDQIYNVTRKLDKDPGAIYSSIDHIQHSAPLIQISIEHDLAPSRSSFSTVSVSKLERLINRVGLLCRHMEEHRKEKKPVTMSDAFRSLATDVTEYTVPQAPTLLEKEDFHKDFALS